MKKSRIASALVVLVSMICLCFCSFALAEDSNGLTKGDIREAEEVVRQYVAAKNEGDYEKAREYETSLLANGHSEFEKDDGVLFDEFEVSYAPEDCARYLRFQAKRLEFADYLPETTITKEQAAYLKDKKLMMLNSSFLVVAKPDAKIDPDHPDILGPWDLNKRWTDWSYCLAKEDGSWKILSEGQ